MHNFVNEIHILRLYSQTLREKTKLFLKYLILLIRMLGSSATISNDIDWSFMSMAALFNFPTRSWNFFTEYSNYEICYAGPFGNLYVETLMLEIIKRYEQLICEYR